MATVRKIRKAICFNQGELAQYLYLASYFHKLLKDEVRRETPEIDKLSSLIQQLIDYLNNKLCEVCEKNFALLQSFYEHRDSIKPRVCLKGSFEGQIVDLFRDTLTAYETSYPANTNSGFKHVERTGTYFFCNDIPSKAREGLYHNPRLNPDKAASYGGLFDLLRMPLSRDQEDQNWISCWEENDRRAESCYKSTIIIPLTLKNIALSDLFLELTNFHNVDRAIYGFLCFDHIKTGYFLEPDIDIGYIFADILSLYVIARLNYTMHSDSFNNALRMIDRRRNAN